MLKNSACLKNWYLIKLQNFHSKIFSLAASCTHVRAWEASIIGIIGGAVPVVFIRVIEAAEIDDPVAAISVHFFTGIWVCLRSVSLKNIYVFSQHRKRLKSRNKYVF